MFNIEEVPFSRFGSYFSMSIHDSEVQGKALYLRIHYDNSPKAFRIDPVRDGKVLDYEIESSPTLLTLRPDGGGRIDFVIAGDGTLRMRGSGISLQLEMPKGRWTNAYAMPSGVWAFNMIPHEVQLALEPLKGILKMDAPWETGKGFCWESSRMIALLSPDQDGIFEAAIDDFITTWIKPDRPDFDVCCNEVSQEYLQWTKGLPAVEERFRETRDLAAYVNWSATVAPSGNIKRPTMYMSKMGMCNVYNWDNVFNAMAHCRHQPELAWDQLMVMADHQDEYGKGASNMNRSALRFIVANSPIHGWGLRYMWDKNPDMITPERQSEAFNYLSRWTDWICNHRTWPEDRLPVHHHGFDCGWDNSSIFDQGVPIITPDQSAYLVLQMETLADLAEALGRNQEALAWRKRRDEMLNALIEDLWQNDRFVGILRPSGKKVICESLLICMPMVLGKRLPKEIQTHLVTRIKDHLTPHGLATEKLDSPNSGCPAASKNQLIIPV
jgi:putative isomerase